MASWACNCCSNLLEHHTDRPSKGFPWSDRGRTVPWSDRSLASRRCCSQNSRELPRPLRRWVGLLKRYFIHSAGEQGFGYQGTTLHRIIPGFMLQVPLLYIIWSWFLLILTSKAKSSALSVVSRVKRIEWFNRMERTISKSCFFAKQQSLKGFSEIRN